MDGLSVREVKGSTGTLGKSSSDVRVLQAEYCHDVVRTGGDGLGTFGFILELTRPFTLLRFVVLHPDVGLVISLVNHVFLWKSRGNLLDNSHVTVSDIEENGMEHRTGVKESLARQAGAFFGSYYSPNCRNCECCF